MIKESAHSISSHRCRFAGFVSIPLLQVCFRAILLSVSVSLAACQVSGPKTTGPSSINSSADWPTYSDEAADVYIKGCRRQYEAAQQVFRDSEQTEFSQATEALNAINRLDILSYEPAGRASLYSNVHPNEFIRAAGEVCEQKFMALINEIRLSVPLYKKIIEVDAADLSALDRYFLQQTRQLFELAGVGLDEADRRRVRELNEEIVKIGQEFATNIRNDVRKLEMAPQELNGLPGDYITAHPLNDRGRVEVTTNAPDYQPFMQYATNDNARLRLYTAYRQRGYPANKEVLTKLLEKRYELAKLLGFQHFADYITVDKMIGSAANAAAFIERVNEIAKQRADHDYTALLERLQKIDPTATKVGDWQKTFLENLIRHESYAVNPQEVRQYFSYKKVRDGIFRLVEDLFDVRIQPWHTDVWHPSVESYEIRQQDALIGQFFLDMHPRDGKYQHAAHFGIREGVKGVQTPLAALVCNFPGGEGSTDLMEHDQVETFLHEFGHLLHTMFGGNLPWMSLAGTNTERDFVEAPSQMLEEWVWDEETLKSFARDSRGEVIPDALIEKMNAARHFGRGIFVRHQMFYAALSLNYYSRNPADINLDRLMVELQNTYSPFDYVDNTYMYAGFGHLDGYSALYYTYMWSLVIAADMFSEFQTHGLRDKTVAARYREKVLAAGGSKPAAELIEDFLGRPFNFQAFAHLLDDDLKH